MDVPLLSNQTSCVQSTSLEHAALLSIFRNQKVTQYLNTHNHYLSRTCNNAGRRISMGAGMDSWEAFEWIVYENLSRGVSICTVRNKQR